MEPVLGLIFAAAWLALVVIPVVRILSRLGLNPWAAVVAVIPLVNIAGLWALAFTEWPTTMPPSARELDRWSSDDQAEFKRLLGERGR
jgi:predicted PurR-regulated permease PerM